MDTRVETPQLNAAKFRDPETTADGSRRAEVAFTGLATLWINTGTLCNIACTNCYIESDPKNDRLAYLTAAEVAAILDQIELKEMGTREIGFTGGEPFMNPEIVPMLADTLGRGFEALVLTNAMKPMWRWKRALLELKERYGARLIGSPSITMDRRRMIGSVGQAALARHCRDSRGWPPTVLPFASLAAPAGVRTSRRCGAAMRVCLPSTPFPSMPAIRISSSCFPRWMAPSTFPRLRKPAGISSVSRPIR